MARPAACDRARTWLSLRLDGELSEIEGALLDAHLARCTSCSTAAAGIAGAVDVLRRTPFETPTIVVPLPHAHGRTSLRSFYAAAASTVAAVVAVTAVGFVAAVHVASRQAPPPKLQRVSAVASGMSDDVQLLSQLKVVRTVHQLPGRIVFPS